MRQRYKDGNYGYGDAKQELFELICDKFKTQRERYNYLISNTEIIEKELQKGADKARIIADQVLNRVRSNIGY